MAEKYSDIIELRQQKAAYIIDNNDTKDWDSFTVTRLFNDMLKTVVASVMNKDVNYHKAFWITGSYGTGKSHAASVLKHLLCDKVENITEYLDSQYIQDTTLKDSVLQLRSQKTLFPITLCGAMNIASETDLAPVLQKEIYTALKNAGIEISVETDYKKYSDHISADPQLWQTYVIDRNPELKSYANDTQTLKEKLDNLDTPIFEMVRQTLSQSRLDIKIDNSNISDWIFEVQDEVRKHGFNGLLIIWDEFTTLINSPIGSGVLNYMQKISEKMQKSENDSFFLLISHPSVFDSLRSQEEKQQTQGRYHMFNYTMEPVSAYKIMAGKFRRKTQDEVFGNFYHQNLDLYSHFSQGSVFAEETINDMQNVFPIHPYTAFLAAYYAREAGAHSRSVFQFIGENQRIREFLDAKDKFAALETVTADYLWDYVVSEFQDKTEKYGAVVQRYNLHINQIEQIGGGCPAVFKAVLLLNALNNIGNGDNVLLTPGEENIKLVFKGTSIESEVEKTLAYFNDNGIIARTPDGLYSILFTALSPKEIEEEKKKLTDSASLFKYTEKVMKYSNTVDNVFKNLLKPLHRPYTINYYSVDSNDATLQSRIRNEAKKAKPWEIVIAAFFARNNQELAQLKECAERYAAEKPFQNILFTVFDTVLSDKDYNRFIEYQAQAAVAQKHNHSEQEEDGRKNSLKIVENWINSAVRGGMFNYYINGTTPGSNSGSVLPRFINTTIAPLVVFTSGPESLESLKNKPDTFWEKKNAKATSDKILLSTTKSEALEKLGQAQPLTQFMQDCVDENLNFIPQCPDNHPFKKIYKFIEKQLDKTGRNEEFNLADILDDLRRPPFGLYPSYAAFAAVAFALRRHSDKIFNPQGMPQSAKNLSEKVSDLFRCWDEGKGFEKLALRFETEESISLCNLLIDIFNFNKNQIQSLRQVRWGINEGKPYGLPLWVLKYAFDSNEKCFNDLNAIVDGILNICKNIDRQDQTVIENTLYLLKSRRFEFSNYLNSEDKFNFGYVNFLKSVKLVELKDDELPAAKEYIIKNLQKERGSWTEDEVRDALVNWREATKPKETTQPETPAVQPVVQPTVDANEPTKPLQTSKRESARQKIRSHNNIDTLKLLLEKIIEKTGDETLLDDIINQL